MEWMWMIILGLVIWVLAGIRILPPYERCPIEFLGWYLWTWGPGPHWHLPGVQRIRAKVDIREQEIPLFEFERPVKIDFRDGSAAPKEAEGWVRIKDPDVRYGPPGSLRKEMSGVERAVYEIGTWRKAVKDLLESTLRSFLNTLTIDEGITLARAGFNLKNNLPEKEQERLRDVLSRWGFELMQITVMDFELEQRLVEARGGVHISQREAEAAEHIRVRRARETIGTVIQMMAESRNKKTAEIQELINTDPNLQKEFITLSKDLIKRQMAIDGKSYVNIQVEGAQGVEKLLLELLAAWKRMPMGPSEEKPVKTQEEKPAPVKTQEDRLRLTRGDLSKRREELKALPKEEREKKIRELSSRILKGEVEIDWRK